MNEKTIGTFYHLEFALSYQEATNTIQFLNTKTDELFLEHPISKEKFVRWLIGREPLYININDSGFEENTWVYQFSLTDRLNAYLSFINYYDVLLLLDNYQTYLMAIKLNGHIVVTRHLGGDQDTYPIAVFSNSDDFLNFVEGSATITDNWISAEHTSGPISINMNDFEKRFKATESEINGFLNN